MKHILNLIALGSFAAALYQPSSIAQDDYMDSELRGRVETLKEAFAQERSNQASARTRARDLWDWMNAYAMTGRHVPPNATSTINRLMALRSGQRVSAGQLVGLDNYITQFTTLDEHPNAIGRALIAETAPIVVETWQTLEVQYHVGERSIVEGGIVLVGRHFMSDAAPWQHSDPQGDNFVSIRSSVAKVAFKPTTTPIRGMHGGFRGSLPQLSFELTEGALNPGDSFTLVYGDKSGGGRGLRMQTYSNDAAPLPLYIQFDADSIFYSIRTPTYRVVGKEAHAVHGFVPSIVAPGEAFDMSVRVEDAYYNRATGPIPELDVSLNGAHFKTLDAGGDAIQILRDIKLDTPGVYRFAFEDPGSVIRGTSDPIWVKEDAGQRIFWGETHGHCGFAEGQGTADGYFLFGRDDACLDFLTLSEHDIWMDDYEWSVLNAASKQYTREGRFIVFPGYEWTSPRARGGHHNVFFRRPGFDRVPNQDAPLLSDLFFGLRSRYNPEDVLVIPHAHQAADWRNSDVNFDRLVEIMSAHGTFEWFGNRYLQFGRQVGFIAASDDHLSHPGYTSGTMYGLRQRGGLAAVLSSELTTDSIFDALRGRRTYATSGARIILEASLNGAEMGTRQPYSDERVLEGRVMGTAPIESVSLLKNGEIVGQRHYARADLTSNAFVQVGFESESIAYGRDNPRGYRPWRGTLEVSGAKLVGVTTPGFQNPRNEWATVDAGNPNKVHFATGTRGRMNNLVLNLDGADADTVIRIALEEGRESGAAPVRIRPAAKIPSADLTFRFSDFEAGSLAHEFQVGRHRDELSLNLIDPAAPMDQTFRFEDSTEPRHGDYYYLRVRQLDGGLAWSSPFWVGGETPR